MKIPIEWESKDSAQSNSSETGLNSDQWEFEECYKQQSAGQVAHSGESFSLTELLYFYCSASARYSMFFNLT